MGDDTGRAIVRIVRELTRDLRGKMRGIVRRATLGGLDVSGAGQTFQALSTANDADDATELFEQYGITGCPPEGSEGIVLSVGGKRSASIGICFGDRSARPSGLAQGEVAVYNNAGASIVLRNDGSIELVPAAGQQVFLGAVEGAAQVVRHGDPVIPAATMATWIAGVQLICAAPAVVALAAVAAPVAPAEFGTAQSLGIGASST